MLYDNRPKKDVYAPLPEIPNLEAFIYALRHKEVWPKNFHWDYDRLDSCAIGLAHALWPKHIEWKTVAHMEHALNIPMKVATDIFINGHSLLLSMLRIPVSPTRIANKLESI